jgi:hypothetical protein
MAQSGAAIADVAAIKNDDINTKQAKATARRNFLTLLDTKAHLLSKSLRPL